MINTRDTMPGENTTSSSSSSLLEYDPDPRLDDLDKYYSMVIMIIQCILAVVGSFGNLLTILAVGLYKKLHKVNHIYVAHLAFVDLVISAYLVPTSVVGLIHGEPSNCAVIGAIALTCLVVSILSLLMIALNRYILICKSINTYAKCYNRYTLIVSIIAMWLWALAVVLPMSSFGGLGWSRKTHYCFFVNYDFTTYLYMTLGLAQGGVVIPAIATSYCYIMIIRKLRTLNAKFTGLVKKQKSHEPADAHRTNTSSLPPDNTTSSSGQATPNSKLTPENGTTDQPETEDDDEANESEYRTPASQVYSVAADLQKDRGRQRRRMHNRRILGLILIFTIFMICWLPIAITFTIDYRQQLPGIVYVTLISFAWVNSAVNVFLYAFTNHLYRFAFKCILTCRFKEINKW